MITLYPLDGWNSFLTVVQADFYIGSFPTSNGKTTYEALPDDASKEAWLIQTALQIKLCNNIKLPDTLTGDLELAQSYMIIHALEVDMIAYDANARAITSETVDVISVTYDASLKGSTTDFPPMTSALLKQYGCSGRSGGFKQIPLGRK